MTVNLQDPNGRKGKVEKTTTKNDAGSNATFNETLRIPYIPGHEILHIELFDWNAFTAHEFLGGENLKLRDLLNAYGLAMNMPMDGKSRH